MILWMMTSLIYLSRWTITMSKSWCVFLLAAALGAQDLPDRRLTPGATVPVTVEQICVIGYSRSVRNVSVEEKREVFRRYHIQYVPHTYEVDHSVPLEIGGSNSIENLWPQQLSGTWNAHMKDALENRLRWMVCNGDLTLKQAQDWIAQDWTSAYRAVFAHTKRR